MTSVSVLNPYLHAQASISVYAKNLQNRSESSESELQLFCSFDTEAFFTWKYCWKKFMQQFNLQKVKFGHQMRGIVYIGKYGELVGEKYLVEKVQLYYFVNTENTSVLHFETILCFIFN